MKFIPLLFFQILIVNYSFSQNNLNVNNLSGYVNPFIGTGGHGHTFPGAVVPFGMVQLSPDTRVDGSWDGCSGYHYSDSIIYGFSHTHLSGTGCSDYGDILLMPIPNVLQPKMLSDQKNYSSTFNHENEKAEAGYYSVKLNNGIHVELTCTERVGFHKYSFNGSSVNIVLDLVHRDEVIDSKLYAINDSVVEGMRESKAWAQNQTVYFYLKFSRPFTDIYLLADSIAEKNADWRVHGKSLKAAFTFSNKNEKPLLVKVGISQTSMEGAKKNLETELPGWDFEKVKADAAADWNKELNKIEVSGKDEAQKKVFYTALYHCMIHPSLADDVDGKYLGRDFKVHQLEPGKHYYTVFSLWDTYRALHPLLTIIDQKRTADFINTFLLEYEQGGRLPVWELSSNETDCMIGYHSVSVIADAAIKGIKFDYKLAIEAMKHSAELDDRGLKTYRERGYISMEDEGESVSKTLEYAYDDWCIAQMTKLVGDTAAYNEFIIRGQYWKNIFDWKRGFMRPKKNGGWYSPFNPFEVNGNYTEANAWQYLFAVPQDIDALISLMGGTQEFEAKLDSLFSVSSQTTGREQSDISGLIGQYAHGNEPSHHMAYLYDYCGAPRKTQERVRQIMSMYADAPDGLIGNEDCGQMSAWYVMSATGLYQVTPGNPIYATNTPLFDEITIHLENEKIFIRSVLDPDLFIRHDEILNGENAIDSIVVETGGIGKPFTKWDIVPSILINPIIHSTSNSFKDDLMISMYCYSSKYKTYFTQNGTAPTLHSKKYSKPFTITASQIIKAIAIDEYGNQSKVVTATFHKTDKNYKVSYLTRYDPQYSGNGELNLIDGESGSTNFHNGQWQGWADGDMELIIDLGKETMISQMGAEFLQDQRSWILMPTKVDFEISTDGKKYLPVATAQNKISDREENPLSQMLFATTVPRNARYVKITAYNYGKLPAWHIGAGGRAWIFCDEIMIEE